MLFVYPKLMKKTPYRKNVVNLLTFEILEDQIEIDYGTYVRFKDGRIAIHAGCEKHNFKLISKNRAVDFINLDLSIAYMHYFKDKYLSNRQIKYYLRKRIDQHISNVESYFYNEV